jgi:hypothetical protein
MPSGSDGFLPYHPLQRTAASRRPPPGKSAYSARNKFAMRNIRRWPDLEFSPSDIRVDTVVGPIPVANVLLLVFFSIFVSFVEFIGVFARF